MKSNKQFHNKSKKIRKMKGGNYIQDIEELIEKATWDDDFPSILHLAADKGLLDVVKVLLTPKNWDTKLKNILSEIEVDVNEEDRIGETPLQYACRPGYMEIVKFLLENGANVNNRGSAHRTPLHNLFYSKVEGSSTITKGKKYFKESAKILIDAGADLNARDIFGYTPLHVHCSKYHFGVQKVVEALSENGADVNARDNYGNTPLHISCFTIRDYQEDNVDKFLELSPIDILIKNGANMFAKNNEGDIPSKYITNPELKKWMNEKIREQQNAKASTLNSITTGEGENRKLLPPNVLDNISSFITHDVSRPLTLEELKCSQDGRDERNISRRLNEKKVDGKLLPREVLDIIRQYRRKGGKRKTNKLKNKK